MFINNPTTKRKIERFSIIISGIIYLIIALDYLSNDKVIYFLVIASIGLTNLVLLKFLTDNTLKFAAIVNGMNAVASGLIFYDRYQQNQGYVIWGVITTFYVLVMIMFIRKILKDKTVSRVIKKHG